MNFLSALGGLWSIEPAADRHINDLMASLDIEAVIQAAKYDDDESASAPYGLNGGVATIGLEGTLLKQGGWMAWLFGGTSTSEFSAAVRQAAMDPQVKSILLCVDSPGGSVAGIEDAGAAVMDARKTKPVYAHVDGMCCSAAYWIASQCEAIYSNQTAQVGSIGVFMKLHDTSAMYEKMGVKTHIVRSGDHKGAGSDGTPITDAQLAEFQRSIDATADVFKGVVGKGRKMKSDKVDAIADGRSWTGADAVKQGLTDGVAPRSSVLSAMQGYVPGRKAIRVAATDSPKGEDMPNVLDQIKALLLGHDSEASDEAKELKAEKEAADHALSVIAKSDADYAAEKARIANEHKVAMDAAVAEARADAANRAVIETFKIAGRITADQVEGSVTIRASNPVAFDALMGNAPVSVLTPGQEPKYVDAAKVAAAVADGGDDAETANLVAAVRKNAGKG